MSSRTGLSAGSSGRFPGALRWLSRTRDLRPKAGSFSSASGIGCGSGVMRTSAMDLLAVVLVLVVVALFVLLVFLVLVVFLVVLDELLGLIGVVLEIVLELL